MNKYLKEFLHRGLMFGGFGPIIAGIVYLIHDSFIGDITVDGTVSFIAIISTYLLAFVHAGASVFNQIENWSIPKSLFAHLSTLYLAYLACYLFNSWIPFKIEVVLIFTLCFVVAYLVIWLAVYFIVKAVEKKLNSRLL